MKEWLTAQEIAAEKLPDMPITKQGVNLMAGREGWNANEYACRTRKGRGGGLEYKIGVLPQHTVRAYREKHIRIGAEAAPAAKGAELTAPGAAALEHAARLAILRAYSAFRRSQNQREGAMKFQFVDLYNASMIVTDDWVRDRVKKLSVRSLARWLDLARHDQARLAVDRQRPRKGKGVLESANGGQVKAFMLGLVKLQPFLAAREVRRQCRARFGETLTMSVGGQEKRVPLPPLRTFQNDLKALKAACEVEIVKETNPDLYRSAMRLSGRGTLQYIETPNELWEIDASPIDALCTDGRKTVYACLDIATRRSVFLVADIPRASAVGLLIRKAILEWGAPEKIRTDNGTDFKAKASQRLFKDLGIEIEYSDAYSPEQKGHIERMIGTFQRQLTVLLPGFVGHSVADRKAIEGRKSFAKRRGQSEAETFDVGLSGAEMQAIIDEWARDDYGRRPHSALDGRSPAEQERRLHYTIRRVDEKALRFLLMPAIGRNGLRTVTKFGIRIHEHDYINGTFLAGEQVFVRVDPDDMGIAHVFASEDGEYRGQATCAKLSGLDHATFLKAERIIQAETLAERSRASDAELKALLKGPSLVERAREIWREDAIAASENVVPMPKPEAEHTTPAIAAALDAATRAERPAPGLSERAAERHAAMLAEASGATAPAPDNVQNLRKSETPRMRYLRALGLEKRIAAGEAVETADALWLGGYQTDSEYRVQKKFHENNGAPLRF